MIDPRYLDLIEIDRELSRRGLEHFVKLAWPVLEPHEPLLWGWAMAAVSEHLQAVTQGQIKRLLINVPPGMSKSLQTCVFWPAWEWGAAEMPELRIISASYSQDYATRDCRRMRDLVTSKWYQDRWPHVRMTRTGEESIANDRTGWRQGVPFSRLTGGRGHRVIIDDPHSTEQAESDAERKRAVRIFRESVPTRLVNPQESAIVVIMQRLHEGDVSGEILSGEYGYDHLMLPMEYERGHPLRSVTSIGFQDPRTEDGELLFPERFSSEVVERDKAVMGSHAVAGQFQQRPAPREGGLIKLAWLQNRYRERGNKPWRIFQSWDTASKTEDQNAPSACLTLAQFGNRVEVWDVFTERLEFPDLFQTAKDLFSKWKPSAVLIEDKDSGQGLIQQLRRATIMPVIPMRPGTLDKATRMSVETPMIESGNLWLPEDAEWVADFIHELTTFPASKFKDRADALSQGLHWMRQKAPRLQGGLSLGSVAGAA